MILVAIEEEVDHLEVMAVKSLELEEVHLEVEEVDQQVLNQEEMVEPVVLTHQIIIVSYSKFTLYFYLIRRVHKVH